MSPQNAALVNALVPFFLGLGLVIYSFLGGRSEPKPPDEPVEGSAPPPPAEDPAVRRLRMARWGGFAMMALGLFNFMTVLNNPVR